MARLWPVAAAAMLVLALAGALSYRAWGHEDLAGQTVNAPERSNHTLQLPDGSSVELHANARLRIQRFENLVVRLELLAGQATFDVTPSGARTFSVKAGNFDVVVMGTRFTVKMPEQAAQGEVEVAVEHGRVRVMRAGGQGEVVLQTSERWSSAPPKSASRVPPEQAEEPPVATPASSANAAPTPPSPAAAPAVSESAASIFEAANRSLIAGQPAEAAKAFDRLRREHRRDGRAALSALELGRVRLDALRDPAGAATALQDALSLGVSGSLRDDALGRLVEAYERSGNVTACRRTREAYLASLPKGTHRAVVSRRCTGE